MKQKPSSRRRRSSSTKSVLRLPDLEHAKAAVLNSLNSADAKRGYRSRSLTGIARNRAWPSTGSWSCVIALISNPVNSPPEPSICALALCAGSHTKRPTAQRRLGCRCSSRERCEETGHPPRKLVNGRAGPCALASPRSPATERKARPRALLALLLACGLRRHEAVALTVDHLQQREEHWAIVDLVGKGGHVRTVPVPDWVRSELDDWLAAAAIDRGKVFRRVNRVGRTWGGGMTVKAVWHIVKESAKTIGIAKLAPHDLRRDLCSAVPRFGR